MKQVEFFEFQNQHSTSYTNPRSIKAHIQVQKPTQTVATNQKPVTFWAVGYTIIGTDSNITAIIIRKIINV